MLCVSFAVLVACVFKVTRSVAKCDTEETGLTNRLSLLTHFILNQSFMNLKPGHNLINEFKKSWLLVYSEQDSVKCFLIYIFHIHRDIFKSVGCYCSGVQYAMG